MQSIAR